jgi:hypothetical protein
MNQGSDREVSVEKPVKGSTLKEKQAATIVGCRSARERSMRWR